MADVDPKDGVIGLKTLLDYEAPSERVEELLRLIPLDIDASDEVKRYVLKQVIEMMQLEYGRYQNKTKITPQLVASLMEGAIDCHVHGATDPFERMQYEDELAFDHDRAPRCARS